MNPLEARKLLGGYITGTLTPDEAKALYEAALQDQELFDELIRSESIREVVADPVARAALLEGLHDPAVSQPWWKRTWVAAGGAAVAIACAAIILVLLTRRTENIASVQVARSTPAVESAPIEPAPEPVPARPAPSRQPVRRKTIPSSEAPTVAAAPPPVRPETQASAVRDLARINVQNEPNRPAAMPVRTLAPMAAVADAAAIPSARVGLKYTMMRGAEVVNASSEFHPGDELEIVAETPAGGYLYAFRRDDDAAWTSLLAGTAVSARTPVSLPAFRIQAGASRVDIMLVVTSEPSPQLRPDQVPAGPDTARPSAKVFFVETVSRPVVVRIPLKVVPAPKEAARP